MSNIGIRLSDLRGEYNVTESIMQAKLLAYVRGCGMVGDTVESKSSTRFPDLFIAGRGRVYLMECKSPKCTGRLRPAHKRRIAELREAGVEVHVIDNYETGRAIIDSWGSDPGATG